MKRRKINLDKEITWLKRDKYGREEIQLRGAQKSDFEKDIKRLEDGEPVDYIIGWKEFLGCKIDLSYKPLISREETEFWVGEAIKELGSNLKVLDIFAGSGCIGLAVLKNCKNVEVTFADKEENCLKQIKKNLGLVGSTGKVVRSDLFSNIKGKFDIIFANPPYIPTKKQKVQKSVKDWEPHQALYSGTDGLVIIGKFLQEAKKYLNPEGRVYLEFGYGQKGAIEKLLKQNKYKNWEFHKDQFGKWRWAEITF